ncbi:MAG: hypothetical protein ABJA60_05735 [Nitrosospira sp.]
MRTENFPKFIHPLDAGELHEILQRISIGTPCLCFIDIGEPFDYQRNISQTMKVGRDEGRLEGGIETGV